MASHKRNCEMILFPRKANSAFTSMHSCIDVKHIQSKFIKAKYSRGVLVCDVKILTNNCVQNSDEADIGILGLLM